MKAAAPKFWISSKYVNRIRYRALTKYEIQAPKMFMHSITAHATWQEAYAATVADREQELIFAEKKLKSAKTALAKAKAMTEPTP